MGERFLGIDLGTSNSAAALFDGAKSEIVQAADGRPYTPSIVHFSAEGPRVGGAARRALVTDPGRVASEFKRLMGTATALEFAGASPQSPSQLAALVLRQLLADARGVLGEAPEQAVISVPALFELPQNAATSEAARLAGLAQVELIPEPVASALAAGWTEADAHAAWLVYDLGGGTFDASLVESREGLLRVVGHDGDNFLGGRDIDLHLLDQVVTALAQRGLAVPERRNPAHAGALRRLRAALEDGKIALSDQDKVMINLPLLDDVVEFSLTQGQVRQASTALVQRSLDVCMRLLAASGHRPRDLARVVLVGGPTRMPLVRQQLQAAFGGVAMPDLDPMTLVAQGAAIYAATVGLATRRAGHSLARTNTPQLPDVIAATDEGAALSAWLQFPPVTADDAPMLVGKLVGRAEDVRAVATLEVHRDDGAWQSAPTSPDDEHAFYMALALRPRTRQGFTLVARNTKGMPLPLRGAEFAVVHGLTLGDPPMARSLGIALANNQVRVFVERGTALPARRTFVLQTVDAVAAGHVGAMVKIPIVQGEAEAAHLCRLVGTLEVPAEALPVAVPAGSDVQVTIDVDRGGRLVAAAYLPLANRVFEQVISLLVPEASLVALEAALTRAVEALAHLSRLSLGDDALHEALRQSPAAVRAIERDLDGARGGDLDLAQRARRGLLELDALVTRGEQAARLPALLHEVATVTIFGTPHIDTQGSPIEQSLARDIALAITTARERRDVAEIERQLRLLQRLVATCAGRDPEVWRRRFRDLRGRQAEFRDGRRGLELLAQGQRQLDASDDAGLRRTVQALWELLPEDPETRAASFASGVR